MQKPHQKTLKTAASLQKKKYRDIEKKFLIEGILPLEEALRSNYRITEIFFTHEVSAKPGIRDLLRSAENKYGAACYEISDRELRKISCEKTPQGIAAIAEKNIFSEKDLNGNILLLDKIRDPGNAGTLFRIAHWFGLGGIVMINESVDVCNPKTVRASMGSVFHIPYS
ncbi:MAG: RNA methyltransferase [Candidatus Marinimicrobia bacterium]|nr:RNA methyltransferase [Candidatus Neomarinimicrobiota bacterium]